MGLQVSHVFAKTAETLVTPNFVIKKDDENAGLVMIHEGSARSGKTWAILQFLYVLSINNKGLVITLARNTLKNCKKTLLKPFLEIINELGVSYRYNKSENLIIINSNSYYFIGLDDPHSGHGDEQDVFYVNEIMGVKEESVEQRVLRTNYFTLVDYNPSEENHYVYNWAKRDVSTFYKSALFKEVQGKYTGEFTLYDYDEETDTSILLLNPFPKEGQVKKIYSNRPSKDHDRQGTSRLWHWQVYGLGNKCAKEGLIFSKWSMTEDYDSIVSEEEIRLGLDFGFVHPNGMVEVKRVGRALYVKELMYKSDLSTGMLVEEINNLNIDTYVKINADAARRDIIQDIYNANYNIHSCKKTKDFKLNMISKLQGFHIYIESNSINFKNEISSWMWRKDRFGNQLPEPVKIEDDLMDALIYACEGLQEEVKNNLPYMVTTV